SVGRDHGVAMSGGRIDVRGNAGDNAGGAPPGAARGMSGGEIIVRGNVGDEAGARMRRGMLAVTGDGGRGMGIGMIAGTVVVFGKAGPGAGRFLKRGSIVALAPIERPAAWGWRCGGWPGGRASWTLVSTPGGVSGRGARWPRSAGAGSRISHTRRFRLAARRGPASGCGPTTRR